VGNKNVQVDMLQFTDNTLFTDDTLFMCTDKPRNILVMKSIMRMFELASSLEINFYKTKLGKCGIDDHSIMNAFLDVLNCKKMEIPFTYLGVSVGGTIGGACSGGI